MNDDGLKKLLQQWRGIEPSGAFEANVRRRTRLAEARPQAWLGELLWRPAFASAAITISVLIGAVAGTMSRPEATRAEMQFMAPGTLAGGYVRLAEEARR